MHPGVGRRFAVLPTALAFLPGTASAQLVDPAALAEAPGTVRAVASFALVLLFGGALLHYRRGYVDRSVDASLERPGVSVVYGLMAFGLVLFTGGYASSQLARIGGVLAGAAVGLAGLVALVLAGLGYLIVGALVTEARGSRQLWYGLVLGAGISAVGWLLLPPLWALAAWVLLAAFGIGGPTREWFHTPRRVDPAAEK